MLHNSPTRYLLLIGLAFLPERVAAQSPVPLPGIDSLFTRWIPSDAPGCAVGVYEGDRVVYTHGYGLANVEHSVPLTPETVFRIGGLSKQFTALAIVLLAGDGKLSLDEPARKYIPELPEFGGTTITIRGLLNQTSGLREFYPDILGRLVGEISLDMVTPNRILDYLRHQQTLNFPSGSRFTYSNTNYTLLGEIVRRVSGQALAVFARERIFVPLGMTHSAYMSPQAIVPHHATAYGPGNRGAWLLAEPNEPDPGPGTANSSVEDLVRWNANMISHRVGGDSGWALMTQPGRSNKGDSIPYALGLEHLMFRGQRIIGHQTRFWGYQAAFLHFPAFGGGVAVLCNRPVVEGRPTTLAQSVAVAAWPARFIAAVAPPQPIARLPLAPFAGVYFDSITHLAFRLDVSGDTLGGSEGVLRLAGPDVYVSSAGFTFQLLARSKAIEASRLIVKDSQSPYAVPDTLTRSGDQWKPDRADLVPYTGKYYSTELDATLTISIIGDDTRGWALLVTPRYGGTPFWFVPMQKDLFEGYESGGNGRFLRDAAGRITQLEVNVRVGTIGLLFSPVSR